MCLWCFARAAQLGGETGLPANWFMDSDAAIMPEDVSGSDEPVIDLHPICNVTPATAGVHDDVPLAQHRGE